MNPHYLMGSSLSISPVNCSISNVKLDVAMKTSLRTKPWCSAGESGADEVKSY